jgi:3-methyladenine DNA glycosylase AlkD
MTTIGHEQDAGASPEERLGAGEAGPQAERAPAGEAGRQAERAPGGEAGPQAERAAACAHQVLAELRAQANPANVEGMARYGISGRGTLGVPMPVLRALARRLGRDHELAQELWRSEVHEARILAALVDEPGRVTQAQMDDWVADLDSWDVCDQLASNLLDRTPFAYDKPQIWARLEGEFQKRAAFALIAALAVHDKKAEDERFIPFLELIREQAGDPRNFVKKAVNWALRSLGKRSRGLHERSLALAEELSLSDSPAARWIGRDAAKELRSEAVQRRLPPPAG